MFVWHCILNHIWVVSINVYQLVAEKATSFSLTPFPETYVLRKLYFSRNQSCDVEWQCGIQSGTCYEKAWLCMKKKAWLCMKKSVALFELSVASRASHPGYDGILCGQMYARISDSSDLGYQMFWAPGTRYVWASWQGCAKSESLDVIRRLHPLLAICVVV